jgi:predicted amidohydrolase
MRICAAQTRPIPGNLDANLRSHLQLIDLAVELHAGLVLFPELSLTGYEPKVSKQLAISPYDSHLERLQSLADMHEIVICVGAPTMTLSGVCISMIIFRHGTRRQVYSKQLLHAAELPYFQRGKGQLLFRIGESAFAPAICYESLQPTHAEHAAGLGSRFYLASVAESARTLAKSGAHYPTVAHAHGMTVLMANCLGPCHEFVAAGRSAAWDHDGTLRAELDGEHEGLLLFDTATSEAGAHYVA